MVCEFGMSEALGPVALATRDGGYLASAAQDGARAFSETTAREIDREVKTLVSHAADRARMILEQDGELLETLAQRLLRDEVIEREDFLALLAEYRGA
jgi:cell division protease FtsH